MCDRQIMGVTDCACCVHVCHTACVLRGKSQRGKESERVCERETDRGWGADYNRTGVCTHNFVT